MSSRLWWGFLCGFICLLFYTVLYISDTSLFVSRTMYYLGLIPMLICMLLAVIYVKSTSEEAFTFKDVVSIAFAVYVFADLIFWAYYVFMLNYYDPSLQEIQKAETIQNALSHYGEGHSEVERMRQMDFSLQWKQVFFSIARGLIGGFIISSILAFILKDRW